ncbi:MAG TPA: DUF6130 family protein, partial [Blastocatellia bacterium]|nr:DUF6130 family protein [Blastocatellia bacterium]
VTAAPMLIAAFVLLITTNGMGSSSFRSEEPAQAKMTATLLDATTNAKAKSATVQVEVSGVKMIDPALSNKRVTPGEGHLHYQVDNGPVIATTTMKLSFHGLTPGAHKIVVMLANNDHSPAGPQQTLEVTVP